MEGRKPRVRDRVEIINCGKSPYNGKKGVIVRQQENIDRNDMKSMVYIVRLDHPHAAWAKEVGFPAEALLVK